MSRSAIRRTAAGAGVPLLLVAAGLITRIPLLSISPAEVDSANFYNALEYGYNITWLRPHAPGYPLYVFMGWLMNMVLDRPHLSLTLLSALLGSFAVAPFYLLLRELVGSRLAIAGALMLIVNPLYWSFSEVALSDVPSTFFVVLAAWLLYAGRRSNAQLLAGCVALSLAIGVRQGNISLGVLLLFPLGYRLLAEKEVPWRPAVLAGAVFGVTSLSWFLPSVLIGTSGFTEYFDAVSRQWSTAVRVYDITQLDSPWLVNFVYRFERFFLGYLLTYPWSGSDDKTPQTLALIAPWLFGFSLYVVSFRPRSPAHVFVALWLLSLAYPVLSIHFLSRYAIPQIPGFIIACMLGYRFFSDELFSHARRSAVLLLVGTGAVLLMYAVKHQPPVDTFEVSPPESAPLGLLFLALGITVLLVGRWVVVRDSLDRLERPGADAGNTGPLAGVPRAAFAIPLLLLFALPYALTGYSLASKAHVTPSPNQRLVEFVKSSFDTSRVTPCWDSQTHSFYEAFAPKAAPVGHKAVQQLYSAHQAGQVLLISDGCEWYDEINEAIGLTEIAHFQGTSPVWSKAPSIYLYATDSR